MRRGCLDFFHAANGKTSADAVKWVYTPYPIVTVTESTDFIHTDQLGTPRAVTDSNQTVIWRWDSTPFGGSLPIEDPDGDGNTFTLSLRFPGQYYDAESGLNYNYFRTYDPTVGRYVEADPLELFGGSNLYLYVNASPLLYGDPEGLFWFPTIRDLSSIAQVYDWVKQRQWDCEFWRRYAIVAGRGAAAGAAAGINAGAPGFFWGLALGAASGIAVEAVQNTKVAAGAAAIFGAIQARRIKASGAGGAVGGGIAAAGGPASAAAGGAAGGLFDALLGKSPGGLTRNTLIGLRGGLQGALADKIVGDLLEDYIPKCKDKECE